jgi:hypothetical protein
MTHPPAKAGGNLMDVEAVLKIAFYPLFLKFASKPIKLNRALAQASPHDASTT